MPEPTATEDRPTPRKLVNAASKESTRGPWPIQRPRRTLVTASTALSGTNGQKRWNRLGGHHSPALVIVALDRSHRTCLRGILRQQSHEKQTTHVSDNADWHLRAGSAAGGDAIRKRSFHNAISFRAEAGGLRAAHEVPGRTRVPLMQEAITWLLEFSRDSPGRSASAHLLVSPGVESAK